MISDVDGLFAKLEAEGEALVRTKLAQGVYAQKANLVVAWLRQKEDGRAEAATAIHVRLAKSAHWAAWVAAIAAVMSALAAIWANLKT